MIVPNKVISFEESILGKLPIVLKHLVKDEYTVRDLFIATEDYFEEIDQFMLAIDVLYILDAIEIKEGVITYVKKN